MICQFCTNKRIDFLQPENQPSHQGVSTRKILKNQDQNQIKKQVEIKSKSTGQVEVRLLKD